MRTFKKFKAHSSKYVVPDTSNYMLIKNYIYLKVHLGIVINIDTFGGLLAELNTVC